MDENRNKLFFTKLPGYAAFLLENCLEEYTRTQIRYSIEEDVPLLRFFKHLSEEEMFTLGVKGSIDFLKVFIENRVAAYIDESTLSYKENQIPTIEREDVLAKDITIVSFVRRKTFRNLIHKYTTDYDTMTEIMEEVDRFLVVSESSSFQAYIEIQQEKITKINDELLQGKEELLELQELADMGSFVWNLIDGSSVFTPGVIKILGVTETTDQGSFMDKVHPQDQGKIQEAFDRALEGSGIFESEYRYIVNGTEKNIWSRGMVTFLDGVPQLMKGNVMDVTNKYKMIEELQESELLSQQSQALTHIGNWSWEIGTDIVTWSDEMYRIYGLEPQSEEINFSRFLSLIHPDDREKRVAEIHESLRTLEAKDYLLRIVNPDGAMKVLRGKGEVVTSEGKAVKLVGTCQDITKEFNLNEELRQKSEELEKLNSSLANKNMELERINKELESFNYVASHDLQEPLRKIQIFTGRILEKGRDQLPGETASYFDKIITSSSRMRLLIEDLLKFSQTSMTESAMENVDLNLIMDEVIQNLSQAIEEQEMTVETGKLPVIKGISFQLRQLFLNLFSNSLKYAKETIPPVAKITSRLVSGNEIHDGLDAAAGLYHEIRFEDNGIGFEQENAEKIFELFQRLHGKEEYSGTGIGLAICKKIVYNHKGFITAKSEPGSGSVFYIYFPA